MENDTLNTNASVDQETVTPDNAEQTTTEQPAKEQVEVKETETPAETKENTEEKQVQGKEENAKYANIRRKAEEWAKERARKEKEVLDKRFSTLAKSAGVDGVSTVEEYLSNLEKVQLDSRLKSGNLNAEELQKIIRENVEQNPVVLQAKEAIAKNRLDEDIREVCQLDPDIKSADDIAALDRADDIFKRVEGGLSLPDAYKIVYFDKLSGKAAAAAKQAAINQARGKAHMEPIKGEAKPTSEEVDIPTNVLSCWKEAFPNDTGAQLKSRYNKTL